MVCTKNVKFAELKMMSPAKPASDHEDTGSAPAPEAILYDGARAQQIRLDAKS